MFLLGIILIAAVLLGVLYAFQNWEPKNPLVRQFLENANRKYAEQQREAQAKADFTNYMEVYALYADVVMQAINNCAGQLGLLSVRDLSAICTANKITRLNNGLVALLYRARKTSDSTASASSIRRVLQDELDVLTSGSFSPVHVVIQLGNDNKVCIMLVDAADLQAARSRELKI